MLLFILLAEYRLYNYLVEDKPSYFLTTIVPPSSLSSYYPVNNYQLLDTHRCFNNNAYQAYCESDSALFIEKKLSKFIQDKKKDDRNTQEE